MNGLVITDIDKGKNAYCTLVDDEPYPEPDGGETGGWKLVTNIQLQGSKEVEGNMLFPLDQIYEVVDLSKRNCTVSDYHQIRKEEGRLLRSLYSNVVYAVWFQNLIDADTFEARELAQSASEPKKAKTKTNAKKTSASKPKAPASKALQGTIRVVRKPARYQGEGSGFDSE